jgi:peptidoglycan/xylan/chitin deacetylase (PgdA/CDA1 family)
LVAVALAVVILTLPAHAGPAARLAAMRLHVPILLYHYIRANPDPRDVAGRQLSVPPPEFARQMDWLAAHGYHPTTLERARLSLERASYLPDKPVILTFDDGYADLYTAAYPVLKRHDFPAMAFIPSSYPGRRGYVTWAQLREMTRSGLLFVGAHTVRHVDLTRVGRDQAATEIARSKAELEDQIGQPVQYLAFPNGHSTAAIQEMVRAGGYNGALGVWFGSSLTFSSRYNWPRITVQGTDSLARFAGYLR